MAKGKPWGFIMPTDGKRPYHLVNPDTRRSYCQIENNATWPLWKKRVAPQYRTLCKNCEGLAARASARQGTGDV
jgi:hypothetical protein